MPRNFHSIPCMLTIMDHYDIYATQYKLTLCHYFRCKRCIWLLEMVAFTRMQYQPLSYIYIYIYILGRLLNLLEEMSVCHYKKIFTLCHYFRCKRCIWLLEMVAFTRMQYQPLSYIYIYIYILGRLLNLLEEMSVCHYKKIFTFVSLFQM